MPTVRPHRAAPLVLLGGLLLLLLGGCLTETPVTPTPAAPSPTATTIAVASATAAPATATPPPATTTTPSPTLAVDLPPGTGTPDNTTIDVLPPEMVTREASPVAGTPTPDILEVATAPPTQAATATPTPRPSATPTNTPTRIPTTVAITSLKPAARLIAFEYNTHIWTVSTDGKTARQLTKEGRNYRPVWAPDGKTLAFLSNRDDPRYRIYFMDPDGGNLHAVSGPVTAASSGNRPDLFGLTYAFSPDGTQLAYVAQLEPYVSSQLMILDIASGAIWPLTAPEGAATPTPPPPPPTATEPPPPSPTPVSGEGTPAPEGTPEPTTPPAPEEPPPPSATPTPPPPPPVVAEQVAQPAWAPDNRTLAYVDNSNLDQDVLYLLDVPTGKRTQLTTEYAVNRAPVFSADGKTILFTSSEGGSMAALQSELYSVRRDGKGRTRLAPGFTAAPGWGTLRRSPNGAKLAVDWSARLGGFGDPWTNEVTVMSAAGKTPVHLTAAYPRPFYGADNPSWAPDSRYLAFHFYYCPNADCTKGSNQIVIADTAAKNVTLAILTDGFAPAWQP